MMTYYPVISGTEISVLGYYNIVMLGKIRGLVKGKVTTAHRVSGSDDLLEK